MNSQELLEYVRRAKDLEIGVYEAQQIQDEFLKASKRISRENLLNRDIYQG